MVTFSALTCYPFISGSVLYRNVKQRKVFFPHCYLLLFFISFFLLAFTKNGDWCGMFFLFIVYFLFSFFNFNVVILFPSSLSLNQTCICLYVVSQAFYRLTFRELFFFSIFSRFPFFLYFIPFFPFCVCIRSSLAIDNLCITALSADSYHSIIEASIRLASGSCREPACLLNLRNAILKPLRQHSWASLLATVTLR